MTGHPKGKYGQATTQGRISVFAALEKSASQGVETAELVAVLTAVGLTDRSAKTTLFKMKRDGLIFGKGVYVGGAGQQRYRYFETQTQCDAYVFEGVPTAQERRQAKLKRAAEREAAKRAAETPEQRVARLAIRNERIRANIWRKRGFAEPPPKRVGGYRGVTPEDARKAAKKAYDREKYLLAKAQRDAERAAREAKRVVKQVARPGSELVTRVESVDAPVSVTKRPTLVGEPIITSRTRVTVAPVRADYRFYVDPSEVRPVFGALPVGRYLEEEVCDAI